MCTHTHYTYMIHTLYVHCTYILHIFYIHYTYNLHTLYIHRTYIVYISTHVHHIIWANYNDLTVLPHWK